MSALANPKQAVFQPTDAVLHMQGMAFLGSCSSHLVCQRNPSRDTDICSTCLQNGKRKKLAVGHSGTLDPLATGLLIVGVGKGTKAVDSFQAQEKEYSGECLRPRSGCKSRYL